MDAVAKADLEIALKEMTLKVLDTLIDHHVQGAELLKKGIEAIPAMKEHYEEAVEIVKLLAPIFKGLYEVAKAWLQAAYAHLVSLFEWAKGVWDSLFNN